MDFGERLIEVREILGFNQTDFSKNLDLTSQSLSRYEKNKVKPSIELLKKLTERFNINSNYLLTGKGERLLSKEGINAKALKQQVIEGLDTLSIKQLQFINDFITLDKE